MIVQKPSGGSDSPRSAQRIMVRERYELNPFAAALVGAMTLIVTVAGAAEPLAPQDSPVAPVPRLVLQITVDQLRGDLPGWFIKNMGEGGFRYLMNQGVWYADAHHAHANTETIVGHTTLATGADPATHGMISSRLSHLARDQGELSGTREMGQRAAIKALKQKFGIGKELIVQPALRLSQPRGHPQQGP